MLTLLEPSSDLSPPLLGREAELAELRTQLLSPVGRLFTVVGPSGVGKTSLVRRAAQEALAHYPEGACFAPAGSLEQPSLFLRELARSFQLQGPSEPRGALFSQLGRRRALLVVDEAGRSQAGLGLLAELMTACPGLKILATSYAPLGLPLERVMKLHGLAPAESAATGALGLFLSIARKADPAYELSPAEAPFVGRICTLLRGNPLSLELAAGLLKLLGAAELCKALEADPALAGQLAEGKERGGLAAILGLGWGLLESERRQGLERLAVFQSPFSRQQADKIAGVSPSLLGLLSVRGLVLRQPNGRYALPAAVQAYALQRLKLDEAMWVRSVQAHDTYFGGLLDGLEGDASLDTLLLEQLPDLRLLWRRHLAAADWERLGRLAPGYRALLSRSHSHQELWDDYAPALAALDKAGSKLTGLSPAPALRAELLRGLTEASLPLGRGSEGQRHGLAAVQALRSLPGQQTALRQVLGTLLALAERCGEIPGLEAALQAELEACRQAADLPGQAEALRLLGLYAGLAGQPDAARHFLSEAAALLRQGGQRVALVHVLNALADRHLKDGQIPAARKAADEIHALAEATSDRSARLWSRRLLADLELHQGHSGRAVSLMQQALDLCDPIDKWSRAYFSNKLGEALRHEGQLASAQSRCADSRELFASIGEAWGQAWAADAQGYAAYLAGDANGVPLMLQASEGLRLIDNSASLCTCLSHLAEAALALGHYQLACTRIREALHLSQSTPTLFLSERLDLLAQAALTLPSDRAAALHAYLLKQDALSFRTRNRCGEALQKLRAELGPAPAKEAEAEGGRMDLRGAYGWIRED